MDLTEGVDGLRAGELSTAAASSESETNLHRNRALRALGVGDLGASDLGASDPTGVGVSGHPTPQQHLGMVKISTPLLVVAIVYLLLTHSSTSSLRPLSLNPKMRYRKLMCLGQEGDLGATDLGASNPTGVGVSGHPTPPNGRGPY